MSPQEPPQQPAIAMRRSRLVMWLAMLAVALTVVLAVVAGARTASLVLAAALLALAITRAVSPPPGPYGIATRSRAFDTAVLVLGAVVITGLTLSLTAPGTLD